MRVPVAGTVCLSVGLSASVSHIAWVCLATPATLTQLRAGKMHAPSWQREQQEAFGSRLEVCGLWSVVCGTVLPSPEDSKW